MTELRSGGEGGRVVLQLAHSIVERIWRGRADRISDIGRNARGRGRIRLITKERWLLSCVLGHKVCCSPLRLLIRTREGTSEIEKAGAERR